MSSVKDLAHIQAYADFSLKAIMPIRAFLARRKAAQAVKISQARMITTRLAGFCKLRPDEFHLLQDACRMTRAHAARTVIWNGNPSRNSRILISGWACRQRYLEDGRRQILSFLLPGDAVEDWAQPNLQTCTSTFALTDVITSDVSSVVKAIARSDYRFKGLASLVRLMAAREIGMLHDQIVRLGRQTAYKRVAHLMLEFHVRLKLAGMAVGDTFAMPLSQETLADSLGLSVVHVNRILLQLQDDELMTLHSGQVTIIDLEMAQQLADWKSSSICMQAQFFQCKDALETGSNLSQSTVVATWEQTRG